MYQLCMHSCLNLNCLEQLFDLKSTRLKVEKSSKGSFTRHYVNIKDIVLDRVPELQGPIVAVAKHLCGAASDMALRCLVQCPRTCISFRLLIINAGVRGIVLAPCCHHQCTWQSFVQPSAANPSQFEMLCRWSSWATTAHDQRRTIGAQCKHFINSARGSYLAANGFAVHVHRYVDDEVTPENTLLIALRQ
jgi:tRNA:m4X modification enzyme